MKRFLLTCALALSALGASTAALAQCYDCGRVQRIEAYTTKRSGTGGAVAGAVVGGLLGNQVGGGTGKTVATVAGVAGGAYAGKKIAENSEKTKYHVTVRMEDGHIETVNQSSVNNLHVGDRVRVKNGKATRY
jgi:outer membrane lipoprotein SlyB